MRDSSLQDRVDHGADVGLLSHHSEIDARVDGTFTHEDKTSQLPVPDRDLVILTVTHVPVHVTFVMRAEPAGEDGQSEDHEDVSVNLSGVLFLPFVSPTGSAM